MHDSKIKEEIEVKRRSDQIKVEVKLTLFYVPDVFFSSNRKHEYAMSTNAFIFVCVIHIMLTVTIHHIMQQ